MLASRAQLEIDVQCQCMSLTCKSYLERSHICVLVMSFAMRSLDTKLSVVPGWKCLGQMMDDCVAILSS